MADISVMNVGGSDYNIKDKTSRTNSTKAMSLSAYYETGNTASQAYSIVGTPINWKGTLYYTKTTVAKGATWAVGTNLTAATNLGKLVRNIKTYVGSDSKLHFVDLTGADTALNFSGTSGIAKVTINNNITIKWQISDKIQIDALELISDSIGGFGIFEITVPASLSTVSWSSASREMSGIIAIDFNGSRKYNSFTARAVSITISGGGTLRIFIQGAETKITINDFTIS